MTTDLTSKAFSFDLRVYIEDTDAGGIVYYVNYLKFMERARTEMLRDLGFGKAAMFADNAMFVVRDINIRYQAPAKLDDCLRVESAVVSLKRVTVLMEQKVYREDKLLASGRVEMACVHSVELRPIAMPSYLYDAIRSVK